MARIRESFWKQAHLAAALPWAWLMHASTPFDGFGDFASRALLWYVMAMSLGILVVFVLFAIRAFWDEWQDDRWAAKRREQEDRRLRSAGPPLGPRSVGEHLREIDNIIGVAARHG